MKRNREALVMRAVGGRTFRLPDPAPRHPYLVGDAASLPTVNSLLAAAPDSPGRPVRSPLGTLAARHVPVLAAS